MVQINLMKETAQLEREQNACVASGPLLWPSSVRAHPSNWREKTNCGVGPDWKLASVLTGSGRASEHEETASSMWHLDLAGGESTTGGSLPRHTEGDVCTHVPAGLCNFVGALCVILASLAACCGAALMEIKQERF